MTETAVEPAGPDAPWTADEMMTIAASRTLHDHDSCFVGIGIPSTAAILARTTRAPDLTLIYESGAIGSRPTTLPLSIGDGELARTALVVVGIPEIFNYWLQPGRIGTGFLGAAQVDRLGNINTTVIGDDYARPKVRLPGAGGAPEIAGACREVTIICRQSKRTFIEHVDFITTVGHGCLPGDRARLGLSGEGPTRVITDMGILEPDPDTRELVLTAVHPNVTVEQVVSSTGWPLQVSRNLAVTEPPTTHELSSLRALTSSDRAVPVT